MTSEKIHSTDEIKDLNSFVGNLKGENVEISKIQNQSLAFIGKIKNFLELTLPKEITLILNEINFCLRKIMVEKGEYPNIALAVNTTNVFKIQNYISILSLIELGYIQEIKGISEAMNILKSIKNLKINNEDKLFIGYKLLESPVVKKNTDNKFLCSFLDLSDKKVDIRRILDNEIFSFDFDSSIIVTVIKKLFSKGYKYNEIIEFIKHSKFKNISLDANSMAEILKQMQILKNEKWGDFIKAVLLQFKFDKNALKELEGNICNIFNHETQSYMCITMIKKTMNIKVKNFHDKIELINTELDNTVTWEDVEYILRKYNLLESFAIIPDSMFNILVKKLGDDFNISIDIYKCIMKRTSKSQRGKFRNTNISNKINFSLNKINEKKVIINSDEQIPNELWTEYIGSGVKVI